MINSSDLKSNEEIKRLKRNEQSKACRLRKKQAIKNYDDNNKISHKILTEDEKRIRRNEQSKACRLRKMQRLNSNTALNTTSNVSHKEETINTVSINKPSSILVGRTNTEMEIEASENINNADIEDLTFNSFTNDKEQQDYELQFLQKTGKNFNKFYKSYYPKLNWYILRIVNDPNIAEDLVNIAFMQSLKKIDTYLPEYNYSTWLFNIAQRLAFTYLKDKKKMATTSIDEQDEEGNSLMNHLESTLEYQEPEDNQKTMLKYEYMMKKIEELPEKYRTIITLREIDGLTYKEIDEVLNIGEQNVKNRIHNGRILLQKKVDQYFKNVDQAM